MGKIYASWRSAGFLQLNKYLTSVTRHLGPTALPTCKKYLLSFLLEWINSTKQNLGPVLGTVHCMNPPKFENRWGDIRFACLGPAQPSDTLKRLSNSIFFPTLMIFMSKEQTVWERACFLALKASDITAHIHTVNPLPLQNSVASSIQPIATNPRTYLSFAWSKTHSSNRGSN